MAESYVLPAGWSWTTLGEICEPIPHIDPTKNPKKVFRYVDISSISNETFEITNPKEHIGAEAPSRARKPIRTGDILVSTVRTYLRNIAQVPPELDGEICSTGLCVLRLIRGIADPLFVFRYVLTKEFSNRLTRQQRGISYPAVTDRYVYAQPIPLPPFAEQKRITTKIEELFSRIREAKRSLQTVPKLARNFHRSILAKAFRGELTERDPNDEPAERLLERIGQEHRRKWEEELRAKGKDPRNCEYREAERPNVDGLPELPKGWTWTSIGEVTESTFYGPRFAKGEYRKEGVITIRTTDLSSNGQIVLKDPPRIPLNEKQIEYFGLKVGDLLVARSGSIGKCGVFDFQGEPAMPSAYLIRFRLFKDLLPPRYVLHYLLSPCGQLLLSEGATAITQANINAQKIRRFVMPLSPAAEMRRIVSKIETLLANADHIEEQVGLAASNADLLERSILSKAFRGELVPQDSNDEPASVLLERIRAQRATTGKKGRFHSQLELVGPATITSKA